MLKRKTSENYMTSEAFCNWDRECITVFSGRFEKNFTIMQKLNSKNFLIVRLTLYCILLN